MGLVCTISAALCLLIGAFVLFIVKAIIDMYILIAILLTSEGCFCQSFCFVFYFFSCDLNLISVVLCLIFLFCV